MKLIYIISVMLFFIFSSCSKFRSGMDSEVLDLTIKVDSLTSKVDEMAKQNKLQEDEISWLESELAEITKEKQAKPAAPVAVAKPAASPSPAPVVKTPDKVVQVKQCQAITNAGKRCSRPALEGSKYCEQHKQIYEPEIPQKK